MKTQEHLLKAYNKANKERREKIANKAGFNSGDEYKAHLESQIKTNIKDKEKLVIHNVYILDRSGSMSGGKLENALKGINKELEELKSDNSVNYLQTFVPFDYGSVGRIGRDFFKVPLHVVSPVYTVARGYTALYQAVGETIEDVLESKAPNEKVLIKVFTDGGENDSKGRFRYPEVLLGLIKQAEEKDITVTFMGTYNDIETVVREIGIDRSNTLEHDNTAQGVMDSFIQTSAATRQYAKKALAGEDTLKGFYKKSGTL